MKTVQYKSLEEISTQTDEWLRKNINSMTKTINSRLRRLYDNGYVDYSYFLHNQGGAVILTKKTYATYNYYLKSASKKATKDQLVLQYNVTQKLYNAKLTKTEIEQDLQEQARRMKISVDSLKFILKFNKENSVLTDLWRQYGSDVGKTINNRKKAGQSNQEIIDNFMEIVKENNNKIDILDKFSGYGEWTSLK